MRVRADSVFISSVLYSIALFALVRGVLWNYYATGDKDILARLDAGLRAEAQTAHYLAFACLAIILIGLIVIWTGYVNRVRSAWLVMFVIAWIWAFPLQVVPFFKGKMVGTFSEWIYTAIHESGLERTATELILSFLLMVVALLLPIRSFFFAPKIGEKPNQRRSLKFISGLAIGLVIGCVALFAWIQVGVAGTAGSLSCKAHPAQQAYETFEVPGPAFSLRVSAFHEENGGFVPGAYYRFEAMPHDGIPMVRVMEFRHDDTVPLPRRNLRFVAPNVGYVFMGWKYAVTTDAGKTWTVWNAEHDLSQWDCCNYCLIGDVQVMGTGRGAMTLNPIPGRRGEVSQLSTSDFGRHWAIP